VDRRKRQQAINLNDVTRKNAEKLFVRKERVGNTGTQGKRLQGDRTGAINHLAVKTKTVGTIGRIKLGKLSIVKEVWLSWKTRLSSLKRKKGIGEKRNGGAANEFWQQPA